MKFLRFAVIALFLALVAFVAFESPVANVAPGAAMLAAGGILWMGFYLCTPADQGLVCISARPQG